MKILPDAEIAVSKNIIEGTIAISIIGCCALAEGLLLWKGAPAGLDGVVLGRILGTLDAALMIVLSYYFGNTRASMQQVDAITAIGKAAANAPINITSAPATVPQSVQKDINTIANSAGVVLPEIPAQQNTGVL